MTPTPADWNPGPRVRELSTLLVGWRSETGTEGEAAFAGRLAALLRDMPYFRDHPDHVAVFDSHGEPPRRNVVALVKGRGARTLALAGHFDTAAIDNYGDLAGLACDPGPLAAALLADLASRARTEQEERALADLRGGDFVPGRAMLDMKSGIAAGLALLERHAADPAREGSLLLLATPDEERNSQGMRALRAVLPGFAAAHGLAIAGAINLDATSDQGDGAEGRAIYRGTIGKLMPFALVVGQPAHAAYPFDGISAHLVASAILAGVEANVALCDRGGGEVSPPPICLEGRDLRGGYEVTTPARVFLAFNWLYHATAPDTLFARFRSEVERALTGAMARFEAQARAYEALAGRRPQGSPRPPRVLDFAALRALAAEAGGPTATGRLDALARTLEAEDDPLTKTRRLVDAHVTEARLGGPAVVVGLASLHYPHTHLDPDAPADRALAAAVEAARVEIEPRLGVAIGYRDTFLGISDMSFLGHAPEAAETGLVAANTPAPDLVDRPPPETLSFPAVNIGPWGRDYHQRLERVHAPYAFDHLPRFLAAIADRFLARADV